ncbi:MAG: MBL fold metallo-hydrolase [Spirochaetes bacterium]|nr:MBL fold metallo-hydrolase [Spirochaetota bacterium]
MKTITLDDGLSVYRFDPPPGEIEGLNFMAVVEGGEVLFLDCGYRACMAAALGELQRLGASPVRAIVSHYHDDHAQGLELLPGIETWGSEAWRATVDIWFEPGKRDALEPDHPVDGPTILRFGRRSIEIVPLPGHTEDSLAIVIDGTWLYAADAILLTNDGAPLLPSVHARPVSKHMAAIDWLRERADCVMIPGHGAVLAGRAAIERDLDNRRRYLEAISGAVESGGGRISFEDAVAGCDPPFLGREWHEHNYR